MPQKIGNSNSFLTSIATTPIIAPKDRLPVSPIKTCAGKELYHKNPTQEPINADMNTTNSPMLGIYIISKLLAKTILPDT